MITYEFRSNGKDVVIKKPVGGRWYIIIDGLCVAHGIRLERDARRLAKNLIQRAREATWIAEDIDDRFLREQERFLGEQE